MAIRDRIKMMDASIKLASMPTAVIKVTVTEMDEYGIWVLGEGLPIHPNEHERFMVFVPYAQLAWMAVNKEIANGG
jgi:hypothetical protein